MGTGRGEHAVLRDCRHPVGGYRVVTRGCGRAIHLQQQAQSEFRLPPPTPRDRTGAAAEGWNHEREHSAPNVHPLLGGSPIGIRPDRLGLASAARDLAAPALKGGAGPGGAVSRRDDPTAGAAQMVGRGCAVRKMAGERRTERRRAVARRRNGQRGRTDGAGGGSHAVQGVRRPVGGQVDRVCQRNRRQRQALPGDGICKDPTCSAAEQVGSLVVQPCVLAVVSVSAKRCRSQPGREDRITSPTGPLLRPTAS